MEEQKINKALAPAEWERLKQKLRWHGDAIQKSSSVRLLLEEPSINELRFTNLGNGSALTVSYNADVPCVFYQTPVDNCHFDFRASADGMTVQFMVRGRPTMLDEMAVVLFSQIMDS